MNKPREFKQMQFAQMTESQLPEGSRVYSNGTWGWVKNGKIEWDWSRSLYERAFGARRARR